MEHLINIDNGGTLTDICAWDGESFAFTKTLTTAFDLSECLFDGLAKVSAEVYGSQDLVKLLQNTQHIRYSTTQGTNALVQRRGPALGLVLEDPTLIDELRGDEDAATLFDALVAGRVAIVNLAKSDDELDFDLVQQVNKLTTDGAARVVVVGESVESEQRMRRILLRKFPRHLLGSVPLLYSWDLVGDRTRHRRAWSGLLNSFLHPVMERFLYQAEHRLRQHRVTNPLLVYRNDGASSRVAKAVALKTYSSGPRGGLEGTRALAESYGLRRVLMMDVGGTTTDIGVVENGVIATNRRGNVMGVPISFPISDVHSSGIGGSSVIGVVDGEIAVGPRSVGAAPGPACFGLGGQEATITDVNLLLGVLDPDTYLNGQMQLDGDRSRTVITQTVAEPLGITLEEALLRMEAGYFRATAKSFAHLVEADTTLAAFGGAGPMSACGAARIAGVRHVLVPRLAAVFSAFGIGFSDIGKSYEVLLPEATTTAAGEVFDAMTVRAERDLFQEGYELTECTRQWSLIREDSAGEAVSTVPYQWGEEVNPGADVACLRLDVTAVLPHTQLPKASSVPASRAVAQGTRSIRSAPDHTAPVPVYQLTEQVSGATADGPAIVEGPFFTARVLDGWRLTVTSGGDLILTDHS